MKKILRNMAIAASMLVVATATVQGQNPLPEPGIPNLTEAWNFSTTRNNIAGSWFVTGTPHTRSIAVKDDKLFVAQSDVIIKIIDAKTGKDTGKTLSVKGVSGGTWPISSIEVLGNDLISSSYGNPCKVYRWKNCEGDPELLFSYPKPDGYDRFGENFGVWGDENNGKIMFVAKPTSGNPSLFVFEIKDGKANAQPTIITCGINLGGQNSTSSALYYGNDQYLIITKDYFPTLIDSNGKKIGDLETKLSSKFGSSGELFRYRGCDYFAGIGTLSSGYGKGVIDIVDITNGLSSATKEFTYPEDANGLGDATNGQVVTDVEYTYTNNGRTLSIFGLVPAQGVAMYSYTAPALYITSKAQDWKTENAVEMNFDPREGTYSYRLVIKDKEDFGFKVSTAKDNWGAFNGGAIGASEDNVNYNLTMGETVQLESGKLGNLVAPSKGIWDITIDMDLNLTITPYIPETLYLRGDVTGWGIDEAYALTPKFDVNNPTTTNDGEYEYESKLITSINGEFKISDNNEDWSGFDFGANGEDKTMVAGATKESWFTSSENYNTNGQTYQYVTFNFYYHPLANNPSWLRMSGEGGEPETINRHHHAYNLSHDAKNEKEVDSYDKTVDFTFYSTGAATTAYIHFRDKNYTPEEIQPLGAIDKTEGGVQSWEVGPVKKGKNEVQIPATWFARGAEYNWEVEIVNFPVEEDIVSKAEVLGGIIGPAYVGIATFTDPDYPEVYGYKALAYPKNTGIYVLDAEDNLVNNNNLYYQCAVMGGSTANSASPIDATTRGTTAYFASWGDTAHGVVAYDITKPSEAPYSVFEGEIATSGLITAANGNKTGSGTSTVAFWGEGDDTRLIVFDEDIFNNKLAQSPIGNNLTTSDALTLVGNGFNGELLNTNVGAVAVKGGIFVSQNREKGMENVTSGLRYISMPEGESLWSSYDMVNIDSEFLPSSCAGVDVSPSGDMLAVATRTGIQIYSLSWNEDGSPNLKRKQFISCPACDDKRTNVKFDAAGNILACNYNNGYFTVTPANAEGARVKTAAPSYKTLMIDDTVTGVEDVLVEDVDCDAVYYNMNGVRMDGDVVTPGVYVKVVGKKATKVVVK